MGEVTFLSRLKSFKKGFHNPAPSADRKRELLPFSSLTESERQDICILVNRAGEGIARCWPLRSFIYRNPLQGFEHLPFDEAVRQGRALFGGQGYLPNETYRSFYHAGRIREEAIIEALKRCGILPQADP
ncbi:MAG: putative inorganic carbon transporter subunit DabA, partial [Nitrospiria bacterium]